MKMKKNFFAEKNIVFVDGSPGGMAAAAEAMPKGQEPPQPEQQPAQPGMPEKAPALPEMPKGPETPPVTENAVLEAGTKTKEAAANKLAATGKKIDALAGIKVDEIKVAA